MRSAFTRSRHRLSSLARYTAGVETRYDPSAIVGDESHQQLARGLLIGARFHSAPVIRLADAKPMQLGQCLRADGRWRLIAFGGQEDEGQNGGAIAGLCEFLIADPASPLKRYTVEGDDQDSVIDVRAVFQSAHQALALERMPALLLPRKGKLGLTDYEKIFCPDVSCGPDIFDKRGIDRARGALVIVRPDQFVAAILPLQDHSGLAAFFEPFMLDRL